MNKNLGSKANNVLKLSTYKDIPKGLNSFIDEGKNLLTTDSVHGNWDYKTDTILYKANTIALHWEEHPDFGEKKKFAWRGLPSGDDTINAEILMSHEAALQVLSKFQLL